MTNKYSDLAKQFVKFGLVGVLNTIISQGITYGIIFFCKCIGLGLNEHTLVFAASFIGFAISVLNSYYWNNKFVFEKTETSTLKSLLKTYVCYGTTWLLSFLLAFLFSNLIDISVLLVPVLSMIITIPLNFFMNKFWAFK